VVPKPSAAELAEVMARLALRADGATFSSQTSLLRPVILAGAPAMVKLSHEPEELIGSQALIGSLRSAADLRRC
jgi:streptomycin 6-kinase